MDASHNDAVVARIAGNLALVHHVHARARDGARAENAGLGMRGG